MMREVRQACSQIRRRISMGKEGRRGKRDSWLSGVSSGVSMVAGCGLRCGRGEEESAIKT